QAGRRCGLCIGIEQRAQLPALLRACSLGKLRHINIADLAQPGGQAELSQPRLQTRALPSGQRAGARQNYLLLRLRHDKPSCWLATCTQEPSLLTAAARALRTRSG